MRYKTIIPSKLNRQLEDILGITKANKALLEIEDKAYKSVLELKQNRWATKQSEYMFHAHGQKVFYEHLTNYLMAEIDKYKPLNIEQLEMDMPKHVDPNQMYLKGL